MIELDGSAGEGGGQILRTGLALSMCTGQPLRIDHIRAKRPKPGLMRQHLACVNAAQAVSGARVSGAELGSTRLDFEPGAVKAGTYRFAVGTAGSCTLVLQTVLPALMLADGESRLVLGGGTHNPMAPPFHFIDRAFAPQLRRTGVGLDLGLRRHGFYPAGGGEIDVAIRPAPGGLVPFDLVARGDLVEAYAECLNPGIARGVAFRELEAVRAAFGWEADRAKVLNTRQNEGPGNALMVTFEHAHVTEVVIAFGEKGRSAEQVAQMAVAEAVAWRDGEGAAGPHLADQLALPLALAVHTSGRTGAYTFTDLTEHARTNFDVIERFLPVRHTVSCEGAGWRVTVAPSG
jgi:RNA 3'-terminal phosphate cyclase (ATP)